MNFVINVNYEDAVGKKYQYNYNIDLSEIMDLRRVGDPPLKNIGNQLEKIKGELEKMYSFFPQLRVIAYSKKNMEEEAERHNIITDEKEKRIK